jgi:2-iminobutanoate/2-iminopropanoate deaminase
MTLHTVFTENAPGAIGPYSQAITAGHLVFVSGQLGMNPKTGELVGPSATDQAKQALTNLQHILTAAGSDLNHVVSVDVYLTDIREFQAVNAVYETFFSSHRPARVALEVSALPKSATVEIRCIAMRISA